MWRFFAGAAACFLLLTGAFLLWQSRAQGPLLPGAPEARGASAPFISGGQQIEAPEASPKNREERRFSRADKNKDGKIEADEIFGARHKAFAKLDINGNGALSFEEWAAKTIDKFKGADSDHSGWLTPVEYATTAPPPPKRKTCSCRQPEAPSENTDQ
ncbi:MAG: EF-hand domain-containing protein [Sphingomicrobium sp.]